MLKWKVPVWVVHVYVKHHGYGVPHVYDLNTMIFSKGILAFLFKVCFIFPNLFSRGNSTLL